MYNTLRNKSKKSREWNKMWSIERKVSEGYCLVLESLIAARMEWKGWQKHRRKKKMNQRGGIQRRRQWGEGLRVFALSVLESSTRLLIRFSILFIFGGEELIWVEVRSPKSQICLCSLLYVVKITLNVRSSCCSLMTPNESWDNRSVHDIQFKVLHLSCFLFCCISVWNFFICINFQIYNLF